MTIASQLVIVPIIFGYLGKEAYGVWAVVGSLVACIPLLQLGLSSAINRQVPLLVVSKKLRKVGDVIISTSCVFFLLSILFVGVGLLAFKFLQNIIKVPPSYISDFRQSILVLTITLAPTIAMNASPAVLSGFQRYDILACGRIFAGVGRVALIYLFLRAGVGIVAVAAISGLVELALQSIYTLSVFRIVGFRTLRFGRLRPTLLIDMFSYGINTLLYSIGSVLLYKTGEVVIAWKLGVSEVASYNVCSMLVLGGVGIAENAVASTKSALTSLYVGGNVSAVKSITLVTSRMLIIFSINAVCLLTLFGPWILKHWLHSAVEGTRLLLGLLAVGHFLRLTQYGGFIALVAIGKHRSLGILTIGTGLCSIVMSVIGLSIFPSSSWVVAVSNLISIAIISGAIVPLQVASVLKFSDGECWSLMFRPGLTSGVVGGLLWVACLLGVDGRSTSGIVSTIGVAIVSGVVICWFLGVTPPERASILSLVDKWWRNTKPSSPL